MEVLGSPGYLEDREKHPSFPGRLSKWWGRMGGSEVSVSLSLKGVQRGLCDRDGDRAV